MSSGLKSCLKKPPPSVSFDMNEEDYDDGDRSGSFEADVEERSEASNDNDMVDKELQDIRQRFCVVKDKQVVADFATIFTSPPENFLADEEFEKIGRRRGELGVLYPPFKGNRQDAIARYQTIKKMEEQNNQEMWKRSMSEGSIFPFSTIHNKRNIAEIRDFYSKESYERSIGKK